MLRTSALFRRPPGRRRAMRRMPVSDQIRQFIRDSFLVDDFTDDESFLASGLLDSLGIVQLVSFVEGEFALRVPDTDLVPENFDSVTKLAAYIERRIQHRAA
jgi:acyl carrier protein